eukprot:6183745-Pleurochrysis_carterae.AAC.1
MAITATFGFPAEAGRRGVAACARQMQLRVISYQLERTCTDGNGFRTVEEIQHCYQWDNDTRLLEQWQSDGSAQHL